MDRLRRPSRVTDPVRAAGPARDRATPAVQARDVAAAGPARARAAPAVRARHLAVLAACVLGAVALVGCGSSTRGGGAGGPGAPATGAGGPAAGHAGEQPGGAGDPPLIATGDDRGSFSVPCGYSHSAPDDPIVHAGHAGASHRHDFFGATTTGAGSTVETLLAGGTTCRSVADRSAYWAPALLAGGRPVTPTHVVAYYRTPVGADARRVRPLPNGLEMIAGDAAATAPQDAAVVHWSCGRDHVSPVPRRCPGGGAELRLVLVFPACWDGVRLRSPDHVSHVARFRTDGDGGGGCPASHPVLLPETTVEVRYPTHLPPGALSLASGPVTGGHGDLLVAWDGDSQAREVEICLRHNRRCDVTSEPARLDTGA